MRSETGHTGRKLGGEFREPPRPKKQAVALIFGQAGSGKTTLGLRYAPSPVAFFDIDQRGAYAARAAVRKGQVIHYLDVRMPKRILNMSDQTLKKIADRELTRVRKHYDLAIAAAIKGDVRTIVWDTMTEFASLVNLAVTGRADRVKSDYGRSVDIVKTTLADIIRAVRETPANLLMLGKAKPIWEGGEPTGEYEFRGPDTLCYDADWAGHIRLKKMSSIKRRRGEEGQKHELQITKAGIRLKELGKVYTSDDWGSEGPFVFACTQQYMGSSSDDWR